jgi:hypothetical protein
MRFVLSHPSGKKRRMDGAPSVKTLRMTARFFIAAHLCGDFHGGQQAIPVKSS